MEVQPTLVIPRRGGAALLEVPLEVGIVRKAQLLRHIRQTRALLEQLFGTVQALVYLEGVGGLPKG